MQVRISHEFEQTNYAAPDRVFPLLCPVEEAKWVPGWKHTLIYSNSGFAEPGCVFTTPNDDGSESTWICTRHDAEKFEVGYVWVRPGIMTARLNIQLEPTASGNTVAHIRYEYTALSAEGAMELAGMDSAWYVKKMKAWEDAINHYLRSGVCATASW